MFMHVVALCMLCEGVCQRRNVVYKGEGGWCGLLTQNPCCWGGDVVKYTWRYVVGAWLPNVHYLCYRV